MRMKNKFHRAGLSAFTLVELLVVMGLLALFATVSITGYNAANRGMADRGAMQATVSTLRIAQQICQIDRVPTRVFFFNQLLSDNSDTTSATLYRGTAVAVKMGGRVTIQPSAVDGLLIDEFADWQNSYPTSGAANSPGIRFYRMAGSQAGGSIDSCSSLVNAYVSEYRLDDYMIQSGTTIKDWAKDHQMTGNEVVYGFEVQSGCSWNVGDAYGVEIARIDLPKGYIFGSTPPKDNKLTSASVASVYFDPEDATPSLSANVPISLMRSGIGGTFSANSIGEVTKSMLEDKSK